MMRKVTEEELETIVPSFGIIETQDDGILVDINTFRLIETVDPETQEITVSIEECDPTKYGIEATWDDVNSLFHFDLKIGGKYYSWHRKSNHRHIGIKDGAIGLVSYSDVHANGMTIGKVKSTVVPEMLGNPALQIVDGYIAINGQSYSDTEFFDVANERTATLSDIKRVKDGVEYDIPLKERPVDVILEEPVQ